MINKKHLNLRTYHNQKTYIYNIFVPFAGLENVQTSSSSFVPDSGQTWLFYCSAEPSGCLSQPALVILFPKYFQLAYRYKKKLQNIKLPILCTLQVGPGCGQSSLWTKDRVAVDASRLLAKIRTITSCIALGHQLVLSIIEIYLPL